MVLAAVTADLEVGVVREEQLGQGEVPDVQDTTVVPGAVHEAGVNIEEVDLLEATALHLVGDGPEALEGACGL